MPRGLGHFEQLILLALLDLADEQAYGVPIRELIEQRTGRRVSPGAVYTALDRMQARGLITSRLGDPTAERGGRRKRLYRLEPAGSRLLAQSVSALQEMTAGPLARAQLQLGDAAAEARQGSR